MTGRAPLRVKPLSAVLLALSVVFAVASIYREFFSAKALPKPPADQQDIRVPTHLPILNRPGMGADPSLSLTGVVKIAPGLRRQWPKGMIVAVAAKWVGGEPYAARVYKGIQPPFTFALGSDNVTMLSSIAPPQQLVLSAQAYDENRNGGAAALRFESAPSAPVIRGATVELLLDLPKATSR